MKKLIFLNFLFIFFLTNLGFSSTTFFNVLCHAKNANISDSFSKEIKGNPQLAKKINVYVFISKKCVHCKKEKAFLEKFKKKHLNVEIIYLDIESKKNLILYQRVLKEFKIRVGGLPTTIVKDKYFIGFFNENTTGKDIEKAIIDAKKTKAEDIVGKLIKKKVVDVVSKTKPQIPEKIKVLFFGEINVKHLSLPLLTILFGVLDGFNPCAMWALAMLLSFLIAAKNRKKMFLLGSVFILVSGIVYFLFMVAWLNLFIFFSYIKWIQISVGIIAAVGGIYYLKEFFFNKENACKVTSNKRHVFRKFLNKIFSLTEHRLPLAILGIIILAFFVNLIDLVCSLGLPVIYTQILSISSLNTLQYYSYITLYIFVFLLNDFIIFSVAFFSLSLINISNKYFRYFRLFGGGLLLILGILLIFKPEYLIF